MCCLWLIFLILSTLSSLADNMVSYTYYSIYLHILLLLMIHTYTYIYIYLSTITARFLVSVF